jgi:hypothetical protein
LSVGYGKRTVTNPATGSFSTFPISEAQIKLEVQEMKDLKIVFDNPELGFRG